MDLIGYQFGHIAENDRVQYVSLSGCLEISKISKSTKASNFNNQSIIKMVLNQANLSAY
jgi:hypothetical protein